MNSLPNYSPIIRTIDAEIRGFEKLEDGYKDLILPIFELTRSRPLKNYPDGDIHVRMGQVRDFVGNRPFILDLTSFNDLMNDQIEDLFDDQDNFREWRAFLDRYSDLNIIPTVHFYEDDLDQLVTVSRLLLRSHDLIAIRIQFDTSADSLNSYIAALDSADIANRTIVIIDGQYVDEASNSECLQKMHSYLGVVTNYNLQRVVIAASSFPKSVLDREVSYDHEGTIEILEFPLYRQLDDEFGLVLPLSYGDYGGAHPIRKNIPGGGWVPRVDVVTESKFNYTRVRREEGGFEEAAKRMVSHRFFDAIECWGKSEIRLAAAGNPSGKSPAFWISVRINQHLTRASSLFGSV